MIIFKTMVYQIFVFDPSDFNMFNVSVKSGVSVLHLNVRSFNKNQELTNVFIYNLNFTLWIIALSETWFKDDHSNLLDIPNYNMISIPCQGMFMILYPCFIL